MTTQIRLGAVAPEAYVLDVTPGDSGVDLSTVSAASFAVQRPDGTVAAWSCSMSNQTASTLKLTHTLLAASTTTTGPHLVYAALTIPSGTVRTAPRVVDILPTFSPG